MIFAFFSARLRRWVLLAVLLPLAGRLLEALGLRLGDRSPRAAAALQTTSGWLRPRTDPTAAPRRRGPFGRRRR